MRHTLPPQLESGLFGSPVNGGCSSISETDSEICNGTSVLNDGVLPALSGVSSDPASQWANELFTMNRSGTDRIDVSVQLPPDNINYDRVELSVFNCPQWGIYAPQVMVYATGSLNGTILQLFADATLSAESCGYLLKFCVSFNGATSIPYLNLVFPYQNNSNFVFLGEITLVGDTSPCAQPELITSRIAPQTLTTG